MCLLLSYTLIIFPILLSASCVFFAGMDFKRRNGGPFPGGASQAKRGKTGAGEWEDSPSQFEEELAMFDDTEMEAEEMEGQAGHDVIPVGECCTEKTHCGTSKMDFLEEEEIIELYK